MVREKKEYLYMFFEVAIYSLVNRTLCFLICTNCAIIFKLKDALYLEGEDEDALDTKGYVQYNYDAGTSLM